MTFPVSLGDHHWPDGPALLAAVAADARAGGGAVVPGQRPSEWLAGLVSTGALDAELVVGLVAALFRSSGEAPVLAEAARIARALDVPALGELIVVCIEAFDTGILLARDPLGEASSVEDVLLSTAVDLADLSERSVRDALLPRLRNAGLPDLEMRVLAAHGTAGELERWLPAVLAEGMTEVGAEVLAERLVVDATVHEAVLDAMSEGPAGGSALLVAALAQRPGGFDLAARLVPGPTADA